MPSTITADAPDRLRRRGRFIDGVTFGAFLQNHREGRNLSLHDIAADTKIGTRHLAALERGDVRAWPGGLYRRAMVRAYATAVGLDPEVTVTEFTEAFAETPVTVEPEMRHFPPAPFQGLVGIRPRASVCLGLAVCATIAALGWAATSSDAAGAMKAPGTESAVVASADESAASTPSESVASASAARSYAAAVQTASRVETAASVEPVETIEGSLRIVSEPAGADVTVNGIRWGRTPVTVRYLAPGEKRVRLSLQGYASAERQLELTADRRAREVRVLLAPTR
jgi:cytoskeletal protein RodZ